MGCKALPSSAVSSQPFWTTWNKSGLMTVAERHTHLQQRQLAVLLVASSHKPAPINHHDFIALAPRPTYPRPIRLYSSSKNNSSNVLPPPPLKPAVAAGLNAGTDRMIIGFTCKVCDHRSYKSMSKKAYATGVVMIKCDGCKNMHLIADHLGWFDSSKPPGTIEDIMREKGETVKRIKVQPPVKFRVAEPSVSNSETDRSTGSDSAVFAAEPESVDIGADGMMEWLPKAIADAELDMMPPREQDSKEIK
ncbi:hypothetical protein BASA50_001234 [Batrachochytrium salamandrivorans]|uniref:DNL-type domain-containing protein n=1 Tax=Batrachochytrium salamandrivorans TaxID=1357716 RepID=A0ABQ8ES11_9FUNG|nr:hypothetical protein BASA62_009788 [Batrachochytrium salamandrivorans]KAH6583935.1 hypothetical protein BASA60_001160 [Batrachochytrium salamandrivorans]KAH6584480.1 hypothetical protein BASA61_007437 [Batrachochytrium salamandrivorans]KAH6585626.1 hypothetical protein BASA50_001234 [Batrachochytrium salamandrivorans]KAH9252880.1 hypothetical protein BASA81_009183 [Batrachochytrium salamandrivorans]